MSSLTQFGTYGYLSSLVSTQLAIVSPSQPSKEINRVNQNQTFFNAKRCRHEQDFCSEGASQVINRRLLTER